MGLTKKLRKLFKGDRRGKKSAEGKYASVRLTEDDIERGVYKKHLGGGSEAWETRGAFQLHFLRKMGMREDSKVMDVGCGPGRAGRHIIDFLDDGNYYGADYNVDFIKAARAMSAEHGLDAKHPRFETVRDFDYGHLDPDFDFAIVFSVLNHCNDRQIEAFFANIAKPLTKGARVYVTHARWFEDSRIEGTPLAVTRQFGEGDFNITKYGWETQDRIFPIIEFTRS